jgi:hypothetical protein
MAERFDMVIEKKAKFYKEIDLQDANGNPISSIGRLIKCVIKESYATETILFTLTEENGGILVLDDALGKIALVILSDATDVDADFGVYDLIRIDEIVPLLGNERLLEGKITFSKGVS